MERLPRSALLVSVNIFNNFHYLNILFFGIDSTFRFILLSLPTDVESKISAVVLLKYFECDFLGWCSRKSWMFWIQERGCIFKKKDIRNF